MAAEPRTAAHFPGSRLSYWCANERRPKAELFLTIVTCAMPSYSRMRRILLFLQPFLENRSPMSQATIDANKALVLAHYDAVTNRHDPDAIRAQLAPDFFDHAAGKRLSAEDVIAHSAAMHETFADLSAVAECLVAERDIVAGRFVWRGRHRSPWRGIQPTGRHVEFRGMTFWRIQDGRIFERWAEIDFVGLERQLRD
ncbi:ester cyclase [Bradyrhizobium sp. UFLA06-06]